MVHTPSREEQWARINRLRESLHDEDEDLRFEARSKIRSAVHALVTQLSFHGPKIIGVTMTVADEWSVVIDYNDIQGDTEWIRGRIDPIRETPQGK